MDQRTLDVALRGVADEVHRQGEVWDLRRGRVTMACIIDADADRIRIVAPVRALEDVSTDQRTAMLEANFDTTLDARYAINGGFVYAAWMHPLQPLVEPELASAVAQVAHLVRTFGTTYTSGVLTFG